MYYKLIGVQASDMDKKTKTFEPNKIVTLWQGSHGCWGRAHMTTSTNGFLTGMGLQIPAGDTTSSSGRRTLFGAIAKYLSAKEGKEVSYDDAVEYTIKKVVGNFMKVSYDRKGRYINAEDITDLPKRRVMFYMFLFKEMSITETCYHWVFEQLTSRGMGFRKAVLLTLACYGSSSMSGKVSLQPRQSGSTIINTNTKVGELKNFVSFNKFYGATLETFREQAGGYNSDDRNYKDYCNVQNAIRFKDNKQKFVKDSNNDRVYNTIQKLCSTPEDVIKWFLDTFGL